MKKMLIAVLTVITAIAVIAPLSACAGGHKHSYGEWITTESPTCTEDGERYRECSCGDKQTEKLPATGHSGGDWISDATGHKKVCTVCGEDFAESAHTFADGKCSVCGYKEQAPAALLFELNEDGNGYTVTGMADTGTIVDIPATHEDLPVVAIGDEAFSGSDITSATIPDSVKIIGDKAFLECTSLLNIDLGGVESIGEYAFQNTAITELNIPTSLTNIGYCAFSKTPKLKYVDIPETVTTVASYAFWNSGLEKVKINGSTSKWDSGYNSEFYQCYNIKEAVLGANVGKYVYYKFEDCSNLEKYVTENSTLFSSANGMLFNKDMTKLIVCPKGIVNAVIPEGVTELNGTTYQEDVSFKSCTKLETVTLPDSMLTIGKNSFNGCGLKQINIPDSVTKIDKSAFENCKSLRNVHIGKGCTTVYNNPFQGCPALDTLTVNEENTKYKSINNNLMQIYNGQACYLQRVNIKGEIPEGTHCIRSYAFADCNAESIVIPASMIEIEISAFSKCTNLKTVTFKGTDGWTVTGNGQSYPSNAVSMDVTNAETNATNLVTTYTKYIWRTEYHMHFQ